MGHLSGIVKPQYFSTVYPKVMEGLLQVLEIYTQSIRKDHLTRSPRPPVPGPGVPVLSIRINDDGYPSLPDRLLEICDSKTEQERLVTLYIAQHYSKSISCHFFTAADSKAKNWRPAVLRMLCLTRICPRVRPRWSRQNICRMT
jgi:hypothetical protein